jgi:hypothetical protein
MTIGCPIGLGNITYEYDYFTGSQVLVYAEDVLIDDCIRVAWATTQNRQPIYGYASQYYNALADGVIFVSGSFWISFKEAAYVPIILRHVAARKSEEDPFFASPAMRPHSGSSHFSSLAQSAHDYGGSTQEGGARRSGIVTRADIQRLMETEARNPDDAEVQRRLHRYAVNISAMSDRQFEDMAEMFEDAIWYGGNSNRGGRADTMSPNFTGGEIEDERFLAIRRADQFPPFDLLVTFGDMNQNAANHTVVRLMDVTIVGTQFGPIESSGEPIYVEFQFIGRNQA